MMYGLSAAIRCTICSRKCGNHGKISRFKSEECAVARKGKIVVRRNELDIQMVAAPIRDKLFGHADHVVPNVPKPSPKHHLLPALQDDAIKFYGAGQKSWYKTSAPAATNLCTVKDHLAKHGFWDRKHDRPKYEVKYQPEVMVDMPPLKGQNVDEHFERLGDEQSAAYRHLLDQFVSAPTPAPPDSWTTARGWTQYTRNADGSTTTKSVACPDDDVIVFDVEVCMQDSIHRPTMATAVSPTAWYSWCSDRLVDGVDGAADGGKKSPALDELIPMGRATRPRAIIGHNVSFDRSFIKEQYDLQPDATRFVDTMSLHISISGLTGYQRALSYSYNSQKRRGVNEGIINQAFKERHQPNPINWEGKRNPLPC